MLSFALAGAMASVPVATAHADTGSAAETKPTITVTPAPAEGGEVTVTGKNFYRGDDKGAATAGIYLGYGPSDAAGFYQGGSQNPVWIAAGKKDEDTARGRTAPLNADGSFSVKVDVPAQSDQNLSFFTSKGHGMGMRDTSQDAKAPITYLEKAEPQPERPQPEKPEPEQPEPQPEKPAPQPQPEKPQPKPQPTPEQPKPEQPKPKPAQPKPAQPKPKPEKPKPRAAKKPAGKGGQLEWGVKESFRKYVVGRIAKGSVVTGGGAAQKPNNGTFTFPNGKGAYKNGKGTVTFDGTVTFKGHGGQMNLTMSKFAVNFTSGTTAQLIMTVKAPKTSVTEAVDLKNARVANLTFPKNALKVKNGKLSLANARAKLTKDGAVAMAGFYEPGTEMDSVSIKAALITGNKPAPLPAPQKPKPAPKPAPEKSKPAPKPAPEKPKPGPKPAPQKPSVDVQTPGSQGLQVQGTQTQGAQAQGSDTQGSGAQGTDTQGAEAGQGKSPAAPICRIEKTPGTPGASTLSWGVKSSFRNYVTGGIAKGSISAGNGAARTADGFTWGAGSGALTSNSGTVSFPGSVHFTGHKGILDTTISGLRVKVTGPGKGQLIANVKSQSMEGKDLSGNNIVFATLSFSGDASKGIKNATVTLTKEGAAGFAGFYDAGLVLDPLTVTVGSAGTVEKEICTDPVTGEVVSPDGTNTPGAGNGPAGAGSASGSSGGQLAATGFGNATLAGTAGILALIGLVLMRGVRRKDSAA